jgi:uridine kinase
MSSDELLARLAAELVATGPRRRVRAAVDGVDGAGKSLFADSLAAVVARHGRPVLRASVDGFHHPSVVRYRRGRGDPVGYFEDSFDLPTLLDALLLPLAPGGDGKVRLAAFDHRADAPVESELVEAPEDAVLVFDGIFSHRDELAPLWDWSLWLDVSPATSAARCAARDGTDPDPLAPTNRRYVEGQALYLARCQPRQRATHVVDNEDWTRPRLLR